MIKLQRFLKLYLAGVTPSEQKVSHKTNTEFFFLIGSLHMNTGLMIISDYEVVAYSVDDPSKFHSSNYSSLVISSL
jgi:hypothetical protein